MSWDFWVRFVNIALIDVALSGDNAIVIGMAAAALPQAVLLIVVADLTMSVDNVIAVAGSAHGHVGLLAAGLMPLPLVAGGVVSTLIDRARWLVYVGAAAISFTAAHMVLEDRAVGARLHASAQAVLAASLAAALLVPAACRGRAARRAGE